MSSPIEYLEKPRWKAVYNYLCLGKHTEEIVGEVVGGVPLNKVEVAFVLNTLEKRGTCFN